MVLNIYIGSCMCEVTLKVSLFLVKLQLYEWASTKNKSANTDDPPRNNNKRTKKSPDGLFPI